MCVGGRGDVGGKGGRGVHQRQAWGEGGWGGGVRQAGLCGSSARA